MSLELLIQASSKLYEQIQEKVDKHNYTNLQTAYSKTAWEQEQKAQLYVFVEYKNPLRETKNNRTELRNNIPKLFEYEGLVSQVKLEFFQIPQKIKKQVREMKKYEQNNKKNYDN
jgi:hypothetical protein